MKTLGVHSEVGQLRQAIIHRPGLELSRLTPGNVGDLLFDDILWAKRAREEYDAFANTLREKGVTVHYFAQLLAVGCHKRVTVSAALIVRRTSHTPVGAARP